MMKIIKKAKGGLTGLYKSSRWSAISKLLDADSRTLLDVGCGDLFIYDKLKDRYRLTLVDYSPKHNLIGKEDVMNLSFPDKSFDIVLCQQVLEHVFDPVKAIAELKRVTAKQLVITVPYEPFFTLLRLLSWEKEHLWAVTPAILRFYLGDPVYENKLFFKRYYLGVWRFG
ncbi:MAG: class I SAM-dependent methyltransferase [Candidatus Omnitrophica bacterium]|nr:class I SAM-dependent methyltransferase [Candidatus Omnitrophota bacterium]